MRQNKGKIKVIEDSLNKFKFKVMTKRKSRTLIVLGMILTIIILIGGFFVYTKDIRYRLADVRFCKNKMSFWNQSKQLKKRCYTDSYSYKIYHNISVYKMKNINEESNAMKIFFAHGENSFKEAEKASREFKMVFRKNFNDNIVDEKFVYSFDKYKVFGFVNRKLGDTNVKISSTRGDAVYLVIYSGETNNPVVGYRIGIALSNPNKYTEWNKSPYKKVSQKDIKNIIKLVFENDKLK